MSGACVLALDFDGVICDSIDECLVSAFNAYMRGTGRWARSVEDVPAAVGDGFRARRYLVRPLEGYWALLHELTTAGRPPDLTRFNELLREHSDEAAAFGTAFLEARTRLRSEDPQGWLSLHRRYDSPTTPVFARLTRMHRTYVVTMKDKSSVAYFNQAWSLGLDMASVFGRDTGMSKADVIRLIMEREGQDLVVFVDDSPVHLAEAHETGATCVWAGWGYTPRGAAELRSDWLEARRPEELEGILDNTALRTS